MTAQVLVTLATAVFVAGDSLGQVPDQLASPSGDANGYISVATPPGDFFGPPQGHNYDGIASPGSPPLGNYVTGNYGLLLPSAGVQAPPQPGNQPIRLMYLLPNNQSSSSDGGRGTRIFNSGQMDHAGSRAVPNYGPLLPSTGVQAPLQPGNQPIRLMYLLPNNQSSSSDGGRGTRIFNSGQMDHAGSRAVPNYGPLLPSTGVQAPLQPGNQPIRLMYLLPNNQSSSDGGRGTRIFNSGQMDHAGSRAVPNYGPLLPSTGVQAPLQPGNQPIRLMYLLPNNQSSSSDGGRGTRIFNSGQMDHAGSRAVPNYGPLLPSTGVQAPLQPGNQPIRLMYLLPNNQSSSDGGRGTRIFNSGQMDHAGSRAVPNYGPLLPSAGVQAPLQPGNQPIRLMYLLPNNQSSSDGGRGTRIFNSGQMDHAGSRAVPNYGPLLPSTGVQAPPQPGNQPIRVMYLLPNNQSSSDDGRGTRIFNSGQMDHAGSRAVPNYVDPMERQRDGYPGAGSVHEEGINNASHADLKASGSSAGLFSAGDFAPPEPQHISVFDDEGDISGGGGGGEGRFIDDDEDQAEPEVIELRVPVAQLVPVAVPYKVAVPVPHPYPVPVEVIERYEVPVEKVVEEVVEKKVPVIVETLVPYPVVKHLPVKVEKIVAVPKPYPHPVPVHVVKYIHHFEKKHHKGGKGR